MLAFAYNLIALFASIDCTFLHNTILAIIIFQTIKRIDNLPIEIWQFIKQHKLLLISIAVFIVYLSLSRLWYDFTEKFYFITINDIEKDILLTILYGFFLLFYATKIDISGLTKHTKMLIAPIFTIPVVFLIDYFTKFSIQEFIYIRKVGINNLHIGMVYYTLLCSFVFSILYAKNKYLISTISAVCSLILITTLSLIMKAGRITPIIFLLYLSVFFSYIIYHKLTHKFFFDYNKNGYFILLILLVGAVVPLHLLTMKKDVNFTHYGHRTIAHRQCIWNTTYTLYKELPQKLIGHGLNSYKAVNIMDSHTEQRLNCDKILSQINNKNTSTKIDIPEKTQKNVKNNLKAQNNNDKQKANSIANEIEFSKINSIALHPHSIILQVLFEFGIIGFVLVSCIFTLAIIDMSKIKASSNKQIALKASIIACFMSSFALFIFSHSLYTFWLWDIVFITIFLLVSARNVVKE